MQKELSKTIKKNGILTSHLPKKEAKEIANLKVVSLVCLSKIQIGDIIYLEFKSEINQGKNSTIILGKKYPFE